MPRSADNLADQQITSPRHRSHDPLPAVAQRAPHIHDALHQRIIRHRDAGPDSCKQIAFDHDLAGSARQLKQHRKRLRSKLDRPTSRIAQLGLLDVERMSVKKEASHIRGVVAQQA